MLTKKMRILKISSLVLGSIMILGSLAGCSKSNSDNTNGSSAVAKSTTLNIMTFAQPQEKVVYDNLAKEYMAKNPNVKLNWTVITQADYATKLKADFAAKKVPDIFYAGPGDVRAYVNADELLPLDDYITKLKIDTSKIWPQAVAKYKYDGTAMGNGTLYALPKDMSAFGFAYNKTMFVKNNIPLPDPKKPYTWDEFLAVCKQLTKDTKGDGKINQWGSGFDPAWSLQPFVWTNGANFLDSTSTKVTIDTPEFKEALQYFADLSLKYKVTPSATENSSLGYYQRWMQGQLGFFACGNWDMATFNNLKNFEYDLIPWPVSPKTNTSYTWSGSLGFAVSKNSENKDEAVKLISYLSADTQTSKELSAANIQMPNNMEYAKGDYITNLTPKKNIQVMFDYFEKTGKALPTDYTYNGEWWTEFTNDITPVLQGKVSVSDFVTTTQPKMQKKLDAAIALSKQQAKK